MDTPNMIIGIVLSAIILLPILLINKSVLQKRKRIIAKLDALAIIDNKKIGELDTWTDNSVIGISTDNSKLYFSRNTDHYVKEIAFDLKNIKECTIVNTFKQGTNNIEKLELLLELYDSKDRVSLEIFKVDEKNFIIGEEMRIAKKWYSKLAS
ncbi:hypothetical protein SY27_13500 [Flavobacterium sp. 316]|uniref:hypothetical protein n=1 Tax=Flavobacterium sp. 316 TaxID=1603293 RepID=UPI0005DCC713|nr:hypothetical protein [Flavobacterium sp. 316]KIX20163.1 hypothetical protein SY27_13500 [Flavobacterium sp. 316]